jgi:RNA polymerase sigma-70 factor (ECF subfamily)
MAVAQRSNRPRRDESAPATLGDLLFGGRAHVPSEKEWVALVRSIAARDERAMHALYRRTYRIVFTLIMRITSNRETAEEVTVDVFHDVWRRAGEYDAANGSVVGWVMNQARSRAIDRLRFDRRKKRVDVGQPQPQGDDRLPDALELEQQRRRVRDALTVLNAAERLAIETAFFSGLTHAEVARRLGQPLGTIKSRIRSGLGKLRRALRREVKR